MGLWFTSQDEHDAQKAANFLEAEEYYLAHKDDYCWWQGERGKFIADYVARAEASRIARQDTGGGVLDWFVNWATRD